MIYACGVWFRRPREGARVPPLSPSRPVSRPSPSPHLSHCHNLSHTVIQYDSNLLHGSSWLTVRPWLLMAFSRGGVATQRGTHGSLVVVALVMLQACAPWKWRSCSRLLFRALQYCTYRSLTRSSKAASLSSFLLGRPLFLPSWVRLGFRRLHH